MKAYLVLFNVDNDYNYGGLYLFNEGRFNRKYSKVFSNLETAKNYVCEVINNEIKNSIISFINDSFNICDSDENKKDWIEYIIRCYKTIDRDDIIPGEFIKTFDNGKERDYMIIQEIELVEDWRPV